MTVLPDPHGPAPPHAVPAPERCGEVTTHLRIQRICVAPPGPPPGQRHGPHIHYYIRRYTTLDTQENP